MIVTLAERWIYPFISKVGLFWTCKVQRTCPDLVEQYYSNKINVLLGFHVWVLQGLSFKKTKKKTCRVWFCFARTDFSPIDIFITF